jgi:hypothetical protein
LGYGKTDPESGHRKLCNRRGSASLTNIRKTLGSEDARKEAAQTESPKCAS